MAAENDEPDPAIDKLANSKGVAAGANICTTSIRALVDALFLLDESWRVGLVREVADELDRRQDQLARKSWHDLLLTTEGSQ